MDFGSWKKTIIGAVLLGLSWQPFSAVQAAPQTLKLGVATPGVKQNALLPYSWDDAWFSDTQDAYRYHHEVARIAGALMSTVYLQPQYHELTSLFQELGCSMDTLEDHHYADLEPAYPDKSGYSFCTKRLMIDGKSIPMVFVVIRGTSGQQEWMSNANIANASEDKEKYHVGFAASAWMIGQDLKQYMESHQLRQPETRIFVTGHSRGAAVANLLGAFLDSGHYVRDEQAAELTPGHVYVYTFATPNVCTDTAERRDSKYRNIFNIVNPEDVVPEVPFRKGSWGYGTYGTTFYLPTANNLRGDSGRYARLLKNMQKSFGQLTSGDTYTPVPGSEWLARDIKGMQWMVGSVRAFYRTDLVLNHEKFVNSLRALPQGEDERADAYYGGMIKLMARWFPKEMAGFEDMHSPATYNAWILSDEPKHIYMRGTPTVVKLQLEGEAAAQAERKHKVGNILGKAPAFPFDLEVQVPGGETILRLKDGRTEQVHAAPGYELQTSRGNTASFTVPEGESVVVRVSAPEAVKVKVTSALEANRENGGSSKAEPLSFGEMSLRDGQSDGFALDENRELREIADVLPDTSGQKQVAE